MTGIEPRRKRNVREYFGVTIFCGFCVLTKGTHMEVVEPVPLDPLFLDSWDRPDCATTNNA
jgi:hypothetical protein